MTFRRPVENDGDYHFYRDHSGQGTVPSLPDAQFFSTRPPVVQHMTSSLMLNNADRRSTTSLTRDVEVPRLNAPTTPVAVSNTKKKNKRSKSKSRSNEMTTSSSTISNLVEQNPLTVTNRSWRNTYGSLPDAELLHVGTTNSTLGPNTSSE
jgi:hypothetical protein